MMPLYPDDFGALGPAAAGIAWFLFLLPRIARISRGVRAERKARR